MAEAIHDFIITEHAAFELTRRGISIEAVRGVLSKPEQREPVRPGREVLQSRISMGQPPKIYLVRVFVDADRSPAEVVTAYRTGKIAKYWRQA